MLIDMHAHSSAISECCRIPYDEVLRCTKENGMDGIFLTNHYQKSYVKDTSSALAERYIQEFEDAKKFGMEIGVRVFWGIEVTMEHYKAVHMLVYGVDTDFLRQHSELFSYTQEELYRAVKKAGGILVQAHPFRNGATVLDPHFLDGVEINCHPLYGKSYKEELLEIAKENNLMVTCGGDYHADTYRPLCGVYLPDELKDSIEIGKYLESQDEFHLKVQEVNGEPEEMIMIK